MSKIGNVAKMLIEYTAVILAKIGLIDEHRGKRVADLAWPRVVTGLGRKSQQTFDIAMIGIAIGPAGIAGLGFAYAYWHIANSLGFSLANGAMTFLSQRFGADDSEGLDITVKQTLWIELTLAGIFTVLFVGFAEPLIALLGAAPDALAQGTLYLQVVAFGITFENVVKIASRTLLSANDAWTPMLVRVGGAIGNIILNAIFIFGFGLGVVGAALGTVIATMAIALILCIGLLRGHLPKIGSLPVQVSAGPPYFDLNVIKQILEVAGPLMAKRLVSRGANFVMLAIIAQFGTVIVAAYTVARQVRGVMNTPGRGFSTAARSLVGQELGANEEQEAGAYGWDILRFAIAVYGVMAVVMFVFAGQIAPLFTDEPAAVQAAVPFIMVMAVSLLGNAVDNASSGILSAGGDTQWPLYARLIGLYVFMIPIAYLGIITPLGILALYVAVTAEKIIPGLITFYRFRSDKWKIISRQYRASPTD